ncbi:EF-hand domain-containing protein [Roseibium litorale]|nr:EF-hand domain-containing protein [Roseibium litorale]
MSKIVFPSLLRILVLGAALPLTVASSLAQGRMGEHFIESWDQDGDGYVTLTEAESRRSDVFAAFDANDDGYLDAEEYVLFDEARETDMRENGGHQNGMGMNPANGMRLQANDADGDGKVSKDEFVGNTKLWMTRLDRTGDGRVGLEDFGRGR